MKKSKAKKPIGIKKTAAAPIVIDQDKGLVFQNEKELYDFFLGEIHQLEQEYFSVRSEQDVSEKEFKRFESHLEKTLEDPDEVWIDSTTLKGRELAIYIRKTKNEPDLYHLALVYLKDDTPSFIYLHFPTTVLETVENYRRGERVFERSLYKNMKLGSVDGDALGEGDELAMGLYQAMLKLRINKDIAENRFQEFVDFREPTIQEPDEIWRTTDLQGHTLVSFVKEFEDVEGPESEIFYIVVTIEDSTTNSHSLLFSFPTLDKNLVDRYRHGENLQADEVVQESAH